MRAITIVVLLGVAVIAAGYRTPSETFKYADKSFLVKQKAVLEVLKHLYQPEIFYKHVEDVKTWNLEDHYDLFLNVEAVKEFVKLFEIGMLEKGEVFSIYNDLHRDWAVSLFNVMYYAKNWDVFEKVMYWASYYCNEGLFVYALTVAVVHRPDMVGIKLPAPYEISPYYFFNSEVIQKAQTYKMQGLRDMKKIDDVYTVVIPSNYTGWYLYTNPDQKVSYFTEDIGLNSYYYYFHTDYPFWMIGGEFHLYKDRRGELYMYMHQQLLARYYMERLSNDLGQIPELSWYGRIKSGYYPNLRYYNGMFFPVRSNDYYPYTENNYFSVNLLEDYERRIRDVIEYGYIMLPDGKLLDLTKPDSIEYIGTMLQGNTDMLNYKVYKYIAYFAKILLSDTVKHFDEKIVIPSVLEHYETAMRDPVFYMLYKRLTKYYWQFKEKLQPYTYDELNFPGVIIERVDVDKLITYFDQFDSDITNAVDVGPWKSPDIAEPDFVIKVRQWRLNHLPFTMKIVINAEKPAKSVIRVFLGPKYDEYGNILSLKENRENFWVLDTFVFDLVAGKNVIARNSKDFTWYVSDTTPYYELYKNVMTSYKGEVKYPMDLSEAHCGFPQRLMLPKGKEAGMPFQMYFVITPYMAPKVEQYSTYDSVVSCGVGSGSKYVDALPFGYPLDRLINERVWYTPNMYYYDAMIYHKKESDINATF